MKVGELGEERHKDGGGGAFYEPSFLVGSILCFLWSLVMSSSIDKVTSLCVCVCVCVCCFLELGEDQCFLIKLGCTQSGLDP